MNNVVGIYDNCNHSSGYSAVKIRGIIREWFSEEQISNIELFSLKIGDIWFVDNKLYFSIDGRKYYCYLGTRLELEVYQSVKMNELINATAINLWIAAVQEKCKVFYIDDYRE